MAFLAVGVAADLAALVLPSTAAGLWLDDQRTIALLGWGGGRRFRLQQHQRRDARVLHHAGRHHRSNCASGCYGGPEP